MKKDKRKAHKIFKTFQRMKTQISKVSYLLITFTHDDASSDRMADLKSHKTTKS